MNKVVLSLNTNMTALLASMGLVGPDASKVAKSPSILSKPVSRELKKLKEFHTKQALPLLRQTGSPYKGRNISAEWRRPHERELLRIMGRREGFLLFQVLRDKAMTMRFKKRKAFAAVRRTIVEITEAARGGKLAFAPKAE